MKYLIGGLMFVSLVFSLALGTFFPAVVVLSGVGFVAGLAAQEPAKWD